MGGGERYPYPKHVWSPAGGWWVRPSNWKANTFIVATGIAGISYMVWQVSDSHTTRYSAPAKELPSLTWAKQLQTERKEEKEL